MWRYKAMRAWLPTSGGQLLNYKTFRMKVIKCNPGFPQHVTRYKQLDYLEHPVCLWQKANPNRWSQFCWNTCDLWLGQKLGWDQKIQDVRITIWRIHREGAVLYFTIHVCYAVLSTLHMWAVRRSEDVITKPLLLNTVTVYEVWFCLTSWNTIIINLCIKSHQAKVLKYVNKRSCLLKLVAQPSVQCIEYSRPVSGPGAGAGP